jgi:hypothetical protein
MRHSQAEEKKRPYLKRKLRKKRSRKQQKKFKKGGSRT